MTLRLNWLLNDLLFTKRPNTLEVNEIHKIVTDA